MIHFALYSSGKHVKQPEIMLTFNKHESHTLAPQVLFCENVRGKLTAWCIKVVLLKYMALN